MSDETDILLKLFEIYNAMRLHNENLSRGSVAAVTGASIALWSIAFGAKTPASIRLWLVIVSALFPIAGILLSRKFRKSNMKLILFSNRIRDNHLRALDYNEPEIIPEDWRKYSDKDFEFKFRSWWGLELLVYAFLSIAIIGLILLILGHARFGLWSTMALFDNLVADLIAFLIALAAIFIFEWMKRPCLIVDLHEARYNDIPAIPQVRLAARVAHLRAVNSPIWRNWVQRNTATNCRSRLTIIYKTGRKLHTNVATKWSKRREPLVNMAIPVAPFFSQYADDYLVGLCNRLDIYANNDGEAFAVALKVDGDPNCYLFRGESYQSTNQLRLPQDMIPPGEFIVEAFVEGDNGKSSTTRYRLHNEGNTPQGLTLEPF